MELFGSLPDCDDEGLGLSSKSFLSCKTRLSTGGLLTLDADADGLLSKSSSSNSFNLAGGSGRTGLSKLVSAEFQRHAANWFSLSLSALSKDGGS